MKPNLTSQCDLVEDSEKKSPGSAVSDACCPSRLYVSDDSPYTKTMVRALDKRASSRSCKGFSFVFLMLMLLLRNDSASGVQDIA